MQLASCLDGQAPMSLGKFTDSNAYLGRVSYIWSVRNCPQIAELVHSNIPSERKAAMQVLRAGAAVMTIAQGH